MAADFESTCPIVDAHVHAIFAWCSGWVDYRISSSKFLAKRSISHWHVGVVENHCFGSGSADCLPVGIVGIAVGGVFRADGHGHASFDGGVGGSLHDVEHPWVVHGFEHQHDGCGQRVFDWRFAVFHGFEQRFNALPCFVGDSGTSIDDFGDGGWRGVRKFGDVR